MTTFRDYSTDDRVRCLEIFDANCPDFFAPNERAEYEAFLEDIVRPEVSPGTGRGRRRAPDVSGYRVCLVEGHIVGAFGMVDRSGWHLRWIMIDPASQGRGVGSTMMTRVSEIGDGRPVSIAASHKSAPFFARFGARIVETTTDGWGPGMHRVDMEL